MIQYEIESRKVMKSLLPYLEDDKKWFFSQYKEKEKKKYREYILLRVTKKNKQIENELNKQKVVFHQSDYCDIYECSSVVEKYFDKFVPLFHAISVLMSIEDKKDKKKIVERILHMTENMYGHSYWKETMDYIHHALSRVYSLGVITGQQRK